MKLSKSELLKQIGSNDLPSLKSAYPEAFDLKPKISRLKYLLENDNLNPDLETIVSRCPGRISLSKHADYINNDLLYALDDRDIFAAGQVIKDPDNFFYGKLVLINQGLSFESKVFETNKIHAEDYKEDWFFYPLKLIEAFQKDLRNYGLVLVYNSDLPAAGGLSSSHALMLSTLSTLSYLFNHQSYIEAIAAEDKAQHKTILFEIIKLCQSIEHARGFHSGLGDQSAQLLSRKGYFSFIKLMNLEGAPLLDLNYQAIPEDLSIITIPSFIKADKSLPEFKSANENIKLYKAVNEIAGKHNCKYLGDLIYKYSEIEIFKILENISDKRLQGLALYGLSEGARVKDLKQDLSLEKLGAHLNLSHQAERNFQNGRALTESEKLNYIFDPKKSLSKHSGIYLASTLENDSLQELTVSCRGVYGSSISGAGLGGNNIAIVHKDSAQALKNQLIDSYYSPKGLLEKAERNLHISSFSAAVGRAL